MCRSPRGLRAPGCRGPGRPGAPGARGPRVLMQVNAVVPDVKIIGTPASGDDVSF